MDPITLYTLYSIQGHYAIYEIIVCPIGLYKAVEIILLNCSSKSYRMIHTI